jgi:hypothetical protein
MSLRTCLLGMMCIGLLSTCGRNDWSQAPDLAAEQGLRQAQPMGAADASVAAGAGAGLAVLAASAPDRYLIKNATLILETADARAATEQLSAALQQVNGYVSNLHESVNALGNRTITMQVRIPADRFDQSMMQAEALGKVLNKQVTTEDVTEQYVDTQARVRNLKHTEDRLLEHLSRTGILEDVLRVEKELTRVREEIERLEGRLRFLTDRVSFSTIAITLQEAARTEPMMPAESFSTGKVTSEAVRALVGFARVIWVMLIWIGVWTPVWVPLAIIALVARRRYLRKETL